MITLERETASTPAPVETPVPRLSWKGHLPALDGLRGLAIIVVMIHHFRLQETASAVDRAYTSVMLGGWAGVDLFFVISGFLITGILVDNKSSSNYFGSFYARRILRIFPLYYGYLALRFWIAPAMVSPEWVDLETSLSQKVWALLYMTNLQSVLVYPGSEASFTGHFWSLAIEEQFYLIWPAVVLFLSRRQLIALCVAMIAGALVVRLVLVFGFGTTWPAYHFTLARMDPIAFGALVALLVRGPQGLAPLMRWARPTLAVSCVALVVALLTTSWSWTESMLMRTFGFSIIAVFFTALLITVLNAPAESRLSRMFTSQSLQFFGRYSYGMYVFHMLLYTLYYDVLRRRGWDFAELPLLFSTQIPAQIAMVATGTTLTIVLSLLSWHLYEKQFLKLKKQFEYGRERPTDTVVAGAPAAPVRIAGL